MEQEYDVIALGTGLKECILSGLMSVNGKKVLHMDRNSYYGGESASLNLEQLYQKFRPNEKAPEALGRSRDYCVDLCPKFLMACGNLVKVLLHTKVTRYLEFKSVSGSYVYRGGKIHKVPATPQEALSSDLMGIFQKRRFRNFLEYCNNWEENDAKSHSGLDVNKMTTKQLFEYHKLEEGTEQFVGHAMALYETDDHLGQASRDCLERVKLYTYSMMRYGNSPYIYPLWGLGGLPEGFSRLCAIHGGVYMLNKPIKQIVYHEDGRVKGVEDLDGKIATCKQLICDPSYVMNTPKVKLTHKIVRCIAILSHPIPNTNTADSCQIIIPFHQIKGRKSDIYICVVSYVHKVAAQGKFIAVINCNMESKDPEAELAPAFDVLGKIDQKFLWITDFYEPTDNGTKDNVFVTATYDSTTHFESATEEVVRLYERIMGKPLDLSISAEPDDLKDDGGQTDAPAE